MGDDCLFVSVLNGNGVMLLGVRTRMSHSGVLYPKAASIHQGNAFNQPLGSKSAPLADEYPRTHWMTDALSILSHDKEPDYTSDDDEIPSFEEATILEVFKQRGTITGGEQTHLDSATPHDGNEDEADNP